MNNNNNLLLQISYLLVFLVAFMPLCYGGKILVNFDAVFLGGLYTVDTNALINYVENGGNVYVMAGQGRGLGY